MAVTAFIIPPPSDTHSANHYHSPTCAAHTITNLPSALAQPLSTHSSISAGIQGLLGHIKTCCWTFSFSPRSFPPKTGLFFKQTELNAMVSTGENIFTRPRHHPPEHPPERKTRINYLVPTKFSLQNGPRPPLSQRGRPNLTVFCKFEGKNRGFFSLLFKDPSIRAPKSIPTKFYCHPRPSWWLGRVGA
jgi:hypothetical protein